MHHFKLEAFISIKPCHSQVILKDIVLLMHIAILDRHEIFLVVDAVWDIINT